MARGSLTYDVAVAGGGAAGVAAAIGAARTGARTVLIESAPFLGGAATLSGVLTYCGFWTQAPVPVQVVTGIGEAVLRGLRALGACEGPHRTAHSGVVIAIIDPEATKLVLDRLCAAAGVDVMLHATVSGATRDGERLHECLVHDHGGTRRVVARAFVDASGEADLSDRAGVRTSYGTEGGVQNGTLAMRIGGIAPDADIDRATWAAAIVAAKARGAALSKEKGFVGRLPLSGDVVAFLADEAYDVRDASSLSAAERRAREQAWAYLEAIRTLPGHERAHLVSTGPSIGTRESRHVAVRYRLCAADVEGCARFDDAIALGGWPVEYHPGPGEPSVWRRLAGDGAYQVPLRSLCSVDCTNLFAAGRTLDADPFAFSSVRVMGTAFATGHAAGVAAALCASGDGAKAQAVRSELLRQGATLDMETA